MHDMMNELGKQVTGIGKPQPGKDGKAEGTLDLVSASKLQQAMADMTGALNKTVIAIEQMAAERA